jgi:hypothetical protein
MTILLVVLGFFTVPGMALWLWKGAARRVIVEAAPRLPNVTGVDGGLRRRRGARRQDEGRS